MKSGIAAVVFYKYRILIIIIEVFAQARVSRGKRPIQNHLYTPKIGTQYPVTKVTSDDVTMMTS